MRHISDRISGVLRSRLLYQCKTDISDLTNHCNNRTSQYQAIHSKELLSCSNVTHWEPDYSSPISEDGVTFRFGVIVCVGGLVGVVSGMVSSMSPYQSVPALVSEWGAFQRTGGGV